MKPAEIERLLTGLSDDNPDFKSTVSRMQEDNAMDFSEGFEDRVLSRLKSENSIYDFDRRFNLAFYRIAFTAAAAVIILMLSIFLNEGSLSIDSLLGVSDMDSESILCVLTGR